jgi:thiol-disulfide isomerase/thioredoxin
MSVRSVVSTVALSAIVALPVGAQTLAQPAVAPRLAPAPDTPAACTKAVSDWTRAETATSLAEYRKATDSTRAGLMAKYQAALGAATAKGRQMAAECAARFSVATIASSELTSLITLYGVAGDTLNVRLATERLLSATDLPPRAQGEALVLGMNQAMAKQSNYFGILDGAEAFAAKIDALPDSLADIKLTAHQRLLGQYEYLDVADGLRHHALAVIALAKELDKPFLAMSGYSSLARSYADKLMPDSALAILDAAEKELGATAADRFKDFRHRYALIGTKAPPISAEWWINTDQKTVVTPAPGRVTLIEFTAHWCGPCKNSYPGISGLAKKFAGRAFDGVMVTSLYGYIGTRQNLTQAQEIEADKVYFGTEHALPFPVAINPPPVRVAGGPYTQPKPDTDYRVGGIPQIIIVDKKGVIRQIVTGWDQGNTERFSKLIEGLLAEP